MHRIAENKEYIIEETISRCCRSLKSSKSYKEAKDKLKEENGFDRGGEK